MFVGKAKWSTWKVHHSRVGLWPHQRESSEPQSGFLSIATLPALSADIKPEWKWQTRLLALPANIWLSWKGLSGTNTLGLLIGDEERSFVIKSRTSSPPSVKPSSWGEWRLFPEWKCQIQKMKNCKKNIFRKIIFEFIFQYISLIIAEETEVNLDEQVFCKGTLKIMNTA
jgi:hypothetical protein